MPGNGEQNAAIGGFGNHQRGVSRQERSRQNEMRALADGQQRAVRAAIERNDVLGVNSTGIDDRFGLQVEDGVVFTVLRLNAGDFAAALDQADGFT